MSSENMTEESGRAAAEEEAEEAEEADDNCALRIRLTWSTPLFTDLLRSSIYDWLKTLIKRFDWWKRGKPSRNPGRSTHFHQKRRSQEPTTMQIQIKTLTGRKQTFNFEPDNTILHVKQALQEKEGIQVDQIRLIYSGKQLADDKTLQDYNVAAGGTIHMVLQLRGGC